MFHDLDKATLKDRRDSLVVLLVIENDHTQRGNVLTPHSRREQISSHRALSSIVLSQSFRKVSLPCQVFQVKKWSRHNVTISKEPLRIKKNKRGTFIGPQMRTYSCSPALFNRHQCSSFSVKSAHVYILPPTQFCKFLLRNHFIIRLWAGTGAVSNCCSSPCLAVRMCGYLVCTAFARLS